MPEPFTLIIETSTPHASIAVALADGHVGQREFTGDRSHNSALFAPLAELLDSLRPALPGLVIVGSGPGSYSGTRVGIAAAQGVAIAAGCPVVAVPSILAVNSVRDGRAGLAIGDARRDSFWMAEVNGRDSGDAPHLTDLDGLTRALARAIDAGVPIFSFEDPVRFPLTVEIRGQVMLEFPDATRLWQAWNAASAVTRDRWAVVTPEPIYLKPPHITPAKRTGLAQP